MLEKMSVAMRHEPSYKHGTLSDEHLGLWMGWTTVAGTSTDCMPIWNEERNICLCISGEVFPDSGELESLRSRGHKFQQNNASYLVHLYEDHGPAFIRGLNGRFAGVLVDLREKKVLLFNDRYGMQRIYLHETEHGFWFASEAKALLKVLPATRSLDWRGFAEFLTCRCVLQNRTLFSGISILPGGSIWTFAGAAPPLKEVYFSPETWEAQPQLLQAEYYDLFKATWKRILPRYFREGERAALSLTGGVDSRMILAWIDAMPGTLPCYTWGSRFRDCMDVRLAREIARVCGQAHHTIPLDGAFLSEFAGLAEKAVYISDGTADATGGLDVYLQRNAREIAPIRLSGAFGSELIRRHVTFKALPLHDGIFTPEIQRLTEVACETYQSERNRHKASFSAFKQAPCYLAGTFSLEESQITLRTPYFDNDLVGLTYQAPPACSDQMFSLKVTRDGNPALGNIWTDRGLSLQAPMAVQKLGRALQQFTFKAEYGYDAGMPHALAAVDSLLSGLHLERLFLGRHKISHFRIWFRDELAPAVKDILLDPISKTRPYLEKGQLERVVKSHVTGSGNYTSEISRILTAELIHRSLFRA